MILGHFYQREEVIAHADYVGDSFQLANAAKAHPEAEAIVFCGVHFMAETADLLSRPEQAVILPNLAAGCSMADMADIDQVEECWEQLEDIYGDMDAVDADGLVPVIPVTYMNSSAAIKGFVGRHGGIVCTSSNARTVLEWAFERGRRVLFFPDQHLGRNTAKAMGVPLEQMPMWNPNKPLGGASADDLLGSRVILWHGFCSVHRRFTVDQIEKARAEHPGVRVIVHPECPMAVVDAADESGSTDYIRRAIEAATEPTTFAIGTEVNLVQRLAAANPQHEIFCLDPVVCPCSTMYRIHPGYLAWVLEGLVDGEVRNRITVPAGCRGPGTTRPGADARRQAAGGAGRSLGERVMTPAVVERAKRDETQRPDGVEVVVVGSGIAGLTVALHAVEHGCRVTLVTKDVLEHANTRYAQGGIAGVMFDDDRVADHIRDTLTAGAGLNDPAAVRVLAEEGPARIRELVDLGVSFDRDAEGAFVKGLEAAHSYPRILHSGGDATGTAIEKALVARLRASSVRVIEHAFLMDLVVRDGRVRGVDLLVGDRAATAETPAVEGRREEIAADAVVLATGGAGELYAHTTNPPVATADGIAAAIRAGAAVDDLEFFQFHPTVLEGSAAAGSFLVSEAVRGEGATLIDEHGRRFAFDAHPDGELAPRDVVARAIARQMELQGGRPVRLDATGLRPTYAERAEFLARRFPTIDRAVRDRGLDWARDPIPVTPAAHYLMGGVVTDIEGRTSIPGLYAVGEVARTGVHGANRLASNSLLEGAVFGARAGDAIAADLADRSVAGAGRGPPGSRRRRGRTRRRRTAVLAPRPAGAHVGRCRTRPRRRRPAARGIRPRCLGGRRSGASHRGRVRRREPPRGRRAARRSSSRPPRVGRRPLPPRRCA